MKKWSQRTLAFISTVLFAVILIAVNVLLYNRNTHADLTRDKMWSISPQLRALLAKLDDVLNVTLYVSPDLPPALIAQHQHTENLLRELAEISGTPIRLRVLEMTPDRIKTDEEELKKYNIQAQPVQIVDRDQYSVKNIYFTLLLQYRDKTQVINVPSQGDFEYRFGRGLVKLMSKDPPVITFLDDAPASEMLRLAGSLSKSLGMSDLFNMEMEDISAGKPIAMSTSTKLVVISSSEHLTDRQLYELDLFVMNGGKMLVFAEGAPFADQMLVFRKPEKMPNLNTLLNSYGFNIKTELVQDWGSSLQVPMEAGREGNLVYMAQAPYPTMPIIVRENISGPWQALRDVSRVVMPFACPVEVKPGLPAEFKAEPLLSTTAKADTQTTAPYELKQPAPNSAESKPRDESKLGKIVVAQSLKGPFKSYFNTRPAPPPEKPEFDDQLTNFRLSGAKYLSPKPSAPEDTQIVVVGSRYMVQQSVLQQFYSLDQLLPQENVTFLQNLIESMTIGDVLSGIRAKQIRVPFLKPDISDEERLMAKVLATFAIPAALVLLGLVWTLLRRARLARLARKYAT